MSAEILLSMGQSKREAAIQRAIPPVPQFAPGQAVEIVDYGWDNGETRIRAVVISQSGEWVAVRGPDIGTCSVHVSRLEACQPQEAA